MCPGLSGALENPRHIFVTDPALHIRHSHVAIKTDLAILSMCIRIFKAEPQHLLAYGRHPRAPENPGHIFVTDPALHIRQSHLSIITD